MGLLENGMRRTIRHVQSSTGMQSYSGTREFDCWLIRHRARSEISQIAKMSLQLGPLLLVKSVVCVGPVDRCANWF